MPAKRLTAWRARAATRVSLAARTGRGSTAARAPAPTPPLAPAFATTAVVILGIAVAVAVAVQRLVVTDLVLRAPHREVHLEGRLERLPVRRALDQRGRQRVLERLAVLERDVVDRLGRVDGLGERDRQPGG